jgi:hypothetical protein
MLKKHLVPGLIALVLIAALVPGYSYLLDRLLTPYRVHMTRTLEKVEQRDRARAAIGIGLPFEERTRLVREKFGELPEKNTVHISMRLADGWRKFCVIAFALLALGTAVDYVARREGAGLSHLATHITALPAFAFALPLLVFRPDAIKMLKWIGVVSIAVFAITLALSALSRREHTKE